MVHTATLTYMFNNTEYGLYEAFKEVPGTIYMQQNIKWFNDSLQDQGINIWCYKLSGFEMYVFVLRINFIRMIEQQNRINVMTFNDINDIEKKFNELIKQITPGMPEFNQWKVNRIDYCCNIYTPYVKEYIKLLQKSDVPPNLKKIANHNGNYAFRPGSYYAVSKARDRRTGKTGSITVNFYDKHQELIYQRDIKNDQRITDEIIDQGINILRLEVQCHKPKTDYLKVKYAMTTKNIHYFLRPEICYDVISRVIKQICGTGSYFKKKKAERIIDTLNCRNTKKNKLKCMLHDIARSSIYNIKNLYNDDGIMKISTFKSYLKLLESVDVNAVVLPRDIKAENGRIDSVMTLFNEAYRNETFIDDSLDLFDIETFIDEELEL